MDCAGFVPWVEEFNVITFPLLPSVLTLSQLLHHLCEAGKVTSDMASQVQAFIQRSKPLPPPSTTTVPPVSTSAYMYFSQDFFPLTALFPPCLPYSLPPPQPLPSTHPLCSQLQALILSKRTNLALSADVGTADDLLKVCSLSEL